MVDVYMEHAQRHTALCARYGKPQSFDVAAALRILGRRDEVHPDDAWAYIYATREAAEAFAASNLANGGVPSLGITAHEGEWLGALDLRRLIRPWVVDPAVPDDGGAEFHKQQRESAANAASN